MKLEYEGTSRPIRFRYLASSYLPLSIHRALKIKTARATHTHIPIPTRTLHSTYPLLRCLHVCSVRATVQLGTRQSQLANFYIFQEDDRSFVATMAENLSETRSKLARYEYRISVGQEKIGNILTLASFTSSCSNEITQQQQVRNTSTVPNYPTA